MMMMMMMMMMMIIMKNRTLDSHLFDELTVLAIDEMMFVACGATRSPPFATQEVRAFSYVLPLSVTTITR